MTEAAKTHLAIDLDEIERRLQQGLQQPAPKTDPLAELARIVGQDDPFRSLLAGEAPARAAAPATGADVFATRAGTPPRDMVGLRGTIPAGHPAGGQASPASHAAPARSFDDYLNAETDWNATAPAYAEPSVAARPTAQAHAYAAPADEPGYDDVAEAWPEQDYADMGRPLQKSRRGRRSLLTVGAVMGVAVVGVTSALMLRGGTVSVGSDTPPVVKAAEGPLKIQPQNPGGLEIPNQNKQIYERATAEEKTRVVNREEQPLDVREAARQAPRVELPPAGGVAVAPTAKPPSPVAALGEPKRVRTVSVRPDGTIVNSDAPAAVEPPRNTVASAGPVALKSDQTSATPQPSPAPAPAAAPVPQPRPTFEAATTGTTTARTGAKPAETPKAAEAKPAEKAPVRVAAVEKPTRIDTPVEAAPAPVPSGGYAVQLTVRDTEQSARQAFGDFKGRYGEAIGGLQPIIRKAQVNGGTIYRVRAGPASLEDANEACQKIKSAGGDCFVAKN